MEYNLLTFKVDDLAVATVTLNRPEIHNAFNDKLIAELTDVFEHLDQDKRVRLIVLTGEGRSFCAGADLNWMSSMINYSMEENIADSKKLAHMFQKINNCSKPVIGKINGHALGGGVGLVSVCDYAITHQKARFGFTEVRLGLIPAVISSFCIKKIGESNARAWFMSGEQFLAQQALHMGLVHEVTDLDNFEKRTQQVIDSYLKAGPQAAVAAKELIQNVISKNANEDEDELLDYACHEIAKKRVSTEGQEGMNALLNKNKPNWIK